MHETEQLPIYEVVPELRKQLRSHPVLILQAPPGAGKSTVLPLELMDEPWLKGKKVLMLEPRRLAAKAVAARMASNIGQQVGDRIGYRVRFDTKIGRKTQVEVVTEGILTRMMQSDNALEETGLVIFDEFHERSIHADLGLVLCRQIQAFLRDDLRILIMSATLNTKDLQSLLPNAPMVQSEGRQYPVDHIYTGAPQGRFLGESAANVIRQALQEQKGDILAFFPGTADIRRAHARLSNSTEADILPLFGDLPQAQQQRAIQPSPAGKRKVVLATSIAETSLTIKGIRTVVDSGKAKVPNFDPRSGLTRLETVDVTLDSADQRAGRAGRLSPGVCYRMWDKRQHQYLSPNRKPEILTADLAPLVLELAHWGETDPLSLDWPTPPPADSVAQATRLLTQLGALEGGKISAWGKNILRLPTHPRLAHLLLVAADLGLSSLAADLVAILEERDPLGRNAGANLCLRLEALLDWRNGRRHAGEAKAMQRLERISKIWRKKMKAEPLKTDPEPGALGRLVAAAYPERIARRTDSSKGRYRLYNSRPVALRREDPLIDEPWLAVAQLDGGFNEGQIYLAAPLFPQDLKDRFEERDVMEWNEGKNQFLARRETRIGTLLVESRTLKEVDPERRATALCEAIRQNPKLLDWTEEVERWQGRVLCMKNWYPQDGWPDVSKERLFESLEHWLGPYLGPLRKREDFAQVKLMGLLQVLIPWDQQQKMDELVPASFEVPSGSKVRMQYFADGRAPVLAVRLQEVFGMMETPSVNRGQTKVMIHLLSPAFRPVQVTMDLKSFWENTYEEVRKELRGRYIKHYWPEDPFSAEAIQGSRKKRPKRKG